MPSVEERVAALGLDGDDGAAEMLAELDKYPNLKKYFTFFMETDAGLPEDPGLLPRLIVWIRTHVDANDIDPAEFFDMDEETAEDFYTWGHNSRWKNVFCDYIESYRSLALARCLELARRYGDPAIDEDKPVGPADPGKGEG